MNKGRGKKSDSFKRKKGGKKKSSAGGWKKIRQVDSLLPKKTNQGGGDLSLTYESIGTGAVQHMLKTKSKTGKEIKP